MTEWVSTTWTCWWTAPCRSMTRRWVTRSLPSQRSMRGKLSTGREAASRSCSTNLPPPEITSMDHPAASPTAKSKIRSSERHVAPDINNHLRSIDLFTPLHAGRQCWGKTTLPGAGYGLGTYRTVDIFNFSHFSLAILEKLHFLCFYIIKSIARKGYFGPKYP